MTQYIRYFIFIVSFLLSMTGYALDHITCTLTSNGFKDPVTAGQEATNTYTCVNTYPNTPRYPAIKLGLLANIQSGAVQSLRVGGSCATQFLASGGTCQFQLAISVQQSAVIAVKVVIGAGLYTIQQPSVFARVGTTPPPSAKITWPGSGSGFAIADTTANGFGGFVADATDSSGHPVVYTFAIISGPGIIVGSQQGYFTLAGVDGTTVVQITATADDAPPVAGTPFAVQLSAVPVKVIAFHNNSPETIYPVIEAPPQAVDQWMQGLFGVTNIGADTFTATLSHRAYVNGTAGIAPGQTTLVYMPFYSNLVPSPSGGSVPDEYVDWWKSMRVYLYDVQSSLVASQLTATPVTLFSAGPTCLSGCASPVTYFSAGVGIPTTDPYQLTEYTFASVITSSPVPYPTYLVEVNFNVSNVDQIYFAAAMEPFGSNLVGYMGSVIDLPSFRTSLSNFVTETGWSEYNNTIYPRVPSAFIALAGGTPLLTSNAAVTNLLTTNWDNCIAASDPDCLAVQSLFQSNWTACGNAGSPTTAQLLLNLYGYTSFCIAQTLPSTGAAFDSYIALQYNYLTKPPGYLQSFNPYTQLIHQTLGANGYAFSVDDAVAFISTIGNGLNISVGGPQGLPNSLQFTNEGVTVVSPGTPSPLVSPYFTNFGICCPASGQTPDCAGDAPNQFVVGGSIPFQFPQSFYPCTITLKDTLNRLFKFTLDSVAPLLSQNITSCSSPASNPGWCSGLVITNPTGPTHPQTTIGTQVPGP